MSLISTTALRFAKIQDPGYLLRQVSCDVSVSKASSLAELLPMLSRSSESLKQYVSSLKTIPATNHSEVFNRGSRALGAAEIGVATFSLGYH